MTSKASSTTPWHLIGFIANNAQRLKCLLYRYRQSTWLRPCDCTAGWGAGQYVSGRILLRTQPGKLDHDLAPTDLLSANADTKCMIASGSTGETTPASGFQPFRYRHWLFATGGNLDLNGERNEILKALPPYLRYSAERASDEKLLFLSFIARRYRSGLLNQPASSAELASLLLIVGQSLSPPVNILTTNGDVLLAYCGDVPLYYCLFENILDCEHCRISGAANVITSADQSHCSFKAICVASRPFDTPETWYEIAARDVFVAGSSMEITP